MRLELVVLFSGYVCNPPLANQLLLEEPPKVSVHGIIYEEVEGEGEMLYDVGYGSKGPVA